MAENEAEQTVEQAEETQEVQVKEAQEVQTEKTKETQETKEESGGSFISRIKARFMGEHTDKEELGEEIPNEFTEAARKMNMSDEDTAAFAAGFQQNEKGEWVDVGNKSFTDEQLKEMIPSLLGEAPAKAEETFDKTEETKSETKEGEVEDSQDGEVLKAALDRIAVLEEKQGISETESKEIEKANFDKRASDLFDETSKDFEVFGKFDNLPRFPHNGELIPTSPQMKARLEVYGRARQLKEAGIPGDEALELSMNAYMGANLKVETQRNVIKGLKEREQTLGGKRVSHKATEAANLTGPEVIAEVKRRHGK